MDNEKVSCPPPDCSVPTSSPHLLDWLKSTDPK